MYERLTHKGKQPAVEPVEEHGFSQHDGLAPDVLARVQQTFDGQLKSPSRKKSVFHGVHRRGNGRFFYLNTLPDGRTGRIYCDTELETAKQRDAQIESEWGSERFKTKVKSNAELIAHHVAQFGEKNAEVAIPELSPPTNCTTGPPITVLSAVLKKPTNGFKAYKTVEGQRKYGVIRYKLEDAQGDF